MTEDELWLEYRETRDIGLRNRIVEENLGFARYVANRLRYRVPDHQSIEDLVSYAYEGLIDAVTKFDPAMGCKFATYAIRRISGAILDGLRKEDELPRAARKMVKDLDKMTAELYDRYGREPTQGELASELNITVETLGFIYRDSLSEHLSVNYEDFDLEDSRYDDPELEAHMNDVAEKLAVVLAEMGEKERIFAYTHYGLNMNLTQIGGLVGVNESRVGQLRANVVHSITNRGDQ